MKELNKLNSFKSLKFKSVNNSEIEDALSLLKTLGYSEHEGGFSVFDAVEDGGFCAWDDGLVTEGWLDDCGFEQVTLGGLKEMVGENKAVLWLNKNTLEEKYLESGSVIKGIDWVKAPEGATFATGDKDNFVFRKDGWYYEHGEWVETNVLLKHFPEYKYLKLFWVKSDVKENLFTLERLLGCEVKINYSGVTGYVTDIIDGGCLHLCCGNSFDVVSKYYLTFFTEDGDELTFDEYVKLYYGE